MVCIWTRRAASYLMQAAEGNLQYIITKLLKANTVMPSKQHKYNGKLPSIKEEHVLIDMYHSAGAHRCPRVPEQTPDMRVSSGSPSASPHSTKTDSECASTTSNWKRKCPSGKPLAPQSKARRSTESLRIYNLAYTNRWSRRELYHQIAPNPPIFLYCSLMLPWVTATVINVESMETALCYMTAAKLSHFSRALGKFDQRPTIVAKKGGEVQGMLLGSVKHWALKKIEEHIGLRNHERDALEVEVATDSGEKIVVVAYVFVWSGEKGVLDDTGWSPEKYMNSID